VQTITTSLVWKFNATPGLAADTSGKAPPHASMLVKASPRAPVATTWTRCYVNGGVGYGVNNQDHFAFDPTGANPNETSAGRGYLGKVGGGCDYQFNPASGWGNWIVGAFADFDLMDLHGGFFDEAAQVTGAPVREIWAGGVGADRFFGHAPNPDLCQRWLDSNAVRCREFPRNQGLIARTNF
jgi:opacity protein-like surface antigen